MRRNPVFLLDDVNAITELVSDNPFVTIVSNTSEGLVASHYPVLVDRDPDHPGQIVLVGHVGRPDEELHELGAHEVLVIVQGRHGYISSSWYGDRAVPQVPTWNFTVAHLHGEVEILSDEENFEVLGRMVDVFEQHVDEPRPMLGSESDAAYARRIAAGTVGFRIRVTRIEAKRKLSQNKAPQVVDGVIDALEAPGRYRHADLAADMRRYRYRGGMRSAPSSRMTSPLR